jgi:5-formyltetrahydrofolate cyclo-ligase
MTDREHVRAALLSARAKVSADDGQRASKAVTARVVGLPSVIAATRLALYRPVRGEIDTGELAQWAWQAGRHVYLPATAPPRSMTFARWRAGDRLVTSRFGIDEPSATARSIAPHRLDVVIVPLVAFDRAGTRLGHGAGYYDATFAFRKGARRRKPLLVGVAHAFQEVEPLERRPWDVALDLVVTEAEVIDCRVAAD